jgi:hypothetical protein
MTDNNVTRTADEPQILRLASLAQDDSVLSDRSNILKCKHEDG